MLLGFSRCHELLRALPYLPVTMNRQQRDDERKGGYKADEHKCLPFLKPRNNTVSHQPRKEQVQYTECQRTYSAKFVKVR